MAYDGGTKLMIVDKAQYNTTAYPTSQYTNIGTVAVPGTHDVYGDGSCGVKSNTWLKGDTIGTRLQFFGAVRDSVAVIGEWQYSMGKSLYVPYSSIQFEGWAYYPMYKSTPVSTPRVSNSRDRYVDWEFFSATGGVSPSPYHNAVDGANDNSPEGNKDVLSSALGDFDGLGNCSGQLQFASVGTKPGDWYVPSLGEIWYLIVRLSGISTPIMSSTRGSDTKTWGVNTSPRALILYNDVSYTYPFLRVVS